MTDTSMEYWTVTSGDLTERRRVIDTPEIVVDPGSALRVIIDPTESHQEWIGAGAAITDSSAYLFRERMSAEQRTTILREMFDPQQGAFNMVRISIGTSDFSSQPYYSYNDLPPGESDSDLKKFSIGDPVERTKDFKYVIPVLQDEASLYPKPSKKY